MKKLLFRIFLETDRSLVTQQAVYHIVEPGGFHVFVLRRMHVGIGIFSSRGDGKVLYTVCRI